MNREPDVVNLGHRTSHFGVDGGVSVRGEAAAGALPARRRRRGVRLSKTINNLQSTSCLLAAVKWPRTYAPVSRVSCECACATLEAAGLTTQGGTGRSVACTESTRGACRSAHGPCHKTADKLSRVVCIMSALSFRGFRPDMNFDHCAKRGRGVCILILVSVL